MILNELEYAKNVLKTYEFDEKISTVLSILAKYYMYHLDLNDEGIIRKLDMFMQKVYPNYSLVKWQDSYDKTVKYAKKQQLLEIKHIPITQEEMDVIDFIKSKPLQRLMFTLLCYAKAYNIINPNNNDWVNVKQRLIFSSAHISKKIDEQSLMLHELYTLGYISFSNNPTNLNIQVNLINNNNNVVLEITDFRELGYEYLLYKGENYTHCEKCDRLFKNNKQKNIKYCNACNKDIIASTKIKNCIDCGKEMIISNTNTRTDKCSVCYEKYRTEYYRLNKKKQREKSKCPQTK